MMIVRKIANRHYVLVQRFNDGSENMLSRIVPAIGNKRQYEATCFGDWERFRTIMDWKKWCVNTYGEYTMMS